MIRLKALLKEDTVRGLNGKSIRTGDTFKVVGGYNGRPFSLTIGSHTQNLNGTQLVLPKGTILTFESEANNGNVWFTFKHPQTKEQIRGKSESGSVLNMLQGGLIK